MSTAPAPGWTTSCRVSRVIDGDTVEVLVVRRLRVRLRNCWAPESRTLDAAEKERGLAAKDALTALAHERDAILHVPSHGEDVGEMLTLGRVVGDVWVEGRNLADEQVRRGHATRTKQPREAEHED